KEWWVTAEGHTLARVQIPTTPARSFAIATKEVTVKQYLRYRSGKDPRDGLMRDISPEPECPMNGISFNEAARYCLWLSRKEGMGEDQMCYEESANSKAIVGRPDALLRTGYRLPTPDEWGDACRAGAEKTLRYFGPWDALLPQYAWHSRNAKGRTWPVAQLRPNDLGLFDMLGNVGECCHGEPPAAKVCGG